MQINFTECINEDCALFHDLSMYDTVDKWLNAIVKGETKYPALDVAVTVDGKSYNIVISGEITKDAEKHVKKIGRIQKLRRKIPNDVIVIDADGFERELYIYVDGKR